MLIPILTGCPPVGPAVLSSGHLDCEAGGHPCSLDKVPLDVLERGESLSDQVLAMLNSGASVSDAQTFVEAQEGVVEAASSHAGLRFRLDGGRDVFILLPEALSTSGHPGATSATAKPIVATHHVVGDDPDAKRALVLAPFQYFFGAEDDGAAVAAILEGTRGYAANVTYLENATTTAATVGIQQFSGWEAYDVIHVTSHGAEVCDVNKCLSVILSGDIYSSAEDLLRLTEAGVNTARIRGSDEKLLALSPEFFRNHYPNGLDRKLIFFNACQTYGTAGSGLSDALLGDGSVYLGWSDVVQSPAARDAALALFRNLSDNGVTAQSALDSLGDLGFNRFTEHGEEITAILLLDRDIDRDLRLREVVTLEHPTKGGNLLPNANVAAVGTAQDGVPDLVPYQILVEGIPESQQDAAVIQFTVGGHSSTPQAVTIGERVGETGWRLTGQIPYVDIQPEQTVEMLATVQLPEGGTSQHRALVNLTGKPEDGQGETWVGQAVSHFDDSLSGQVHVTLEATVTFKQTASTIGGRFKRLGSTGGTMVWSRSGTIETAFDGECAYSAGPLEVPILVDDGEIIIDTSVTPNTYTLIGSTQGFEVRLAENCNNYAFSTRTRGSWAPALGTSDGAQVSPDGGTISGTTADNLQTWEWTFTRQ